MLTFRVETPSWAYDLCTGWVAPEPSWTDTGLTFPSPYSAAQYAKTVLGRVVDEETTLSEPAHGGVVDEATWALKGVMAPKMTVDGVWVSMAPPDGASY